MNSIILTMLFAIILFKKNQVETEKHIAAHIKCILLTRM